MYKLLFCTALFLFLPFNISFAQNEESQEEIENQLFNESLKMHQPLTDEQIMLYREFAREQEEAMSAVVPSLDTRTVQVTLEPGNEPIKVYTTANTVTALVFHDVTGSPWEVTSLTNGSPTAFQILKPEIPDGNLINILPLESNASTSLIVTFKDKDIPLVIAIQSDNIKASERNADSLVLVQLAHMGPKAHIPIVERLMETVSSTLIAFLDQVPPDTAKLIKMQQSIDNLKAWKFEDKLYLRTNDLLIFPSWTAVVHGAGGIKCYEISALTNRILLSVDGKIQSIDVEF